MTWTMTIQTPQKLPMTLPKIGNSSQEWSSKWWTPTLISLPAWSKWVKSPIQTFTWSIICLSFIKWSFSASTKVVSELLTSLRRKGLLPLIFKTERRRRQFTAAWWCWPRIYKSLKARSRNQRLLMNSFFRGYYQPISLFRKHTRIMTPAKSTGRPKMDIKRCYLKSSSTWKQEPPD